MACMNSENLCRICVKESNFYSNIFYEQLDDGSLFVDVVNDLLQLDIKFEDGCPQFLCSMCYNKISDFEGFKRTAHESKAVLLYASGNLGNNTIKLEDAYDNNEEFVPVQNEVYLVPVKMERDDDSPPLDRDPLQDGMGIKTEYPCNPDEHLSNSGHEQSFEKHFIPVKVEEDYDSEPHETVEDYGTEPPDRDSLQVFNPPVHLAESTHVMEYEAAVQRHEQHMMQLNMLNLVDNGDMKVKDNKRKYSNKGRQLKCNECGEEFRNKRDMLSHTKLHNNAIDKELKSGDSEKITVKKSFKCNSCHKEFSKSSNLAVHRRIHTGEKPYECNLCGKGFSQKCSLKRHERTHTGERPFKCNSCDKEFTECYHLRQHERSHQGERPFRCNLCNKEYLESSHLRYHMRVHSGTKPFKCNMCDKRFNQKAHLMVHKRVHTGERPFQCNLCHKQFSQSVNLKTHERLHTGEKPYKCKVCGKLMSQISSLIAHERVHSGERPFKCKFCDKSFPQGCHLKTHEKIHITKNSFNPQLFS